MCQYCFGDLLMRDQMRMVCAFVIPSVDCLQLERYSEDFRFRLLT